MKVTDLSLGHLDSASADPPSQRRKTQTLNRLKWCRGSAHVTQEKHPKCLRHRPLSPGSQTQRQPSLLQSGTFPFTSVLPRRMWGSSALLGSFNLPLCCPSFKGKTGKTQEGH